MRSLAHQLIMGFCRWYFQCEKFYKMGDNHAIFYGTTDAYARAMDMLNESGHKNKSILIECQEEYGALRGYTTLSALERIE